MRRTLQTAFLSVDWLLEQGATIKANPDWQENSEKPCDNGSLTTLLETSYPTVDFTSCQPPWPDKTSPSARDFAHTRQAVVKRGTRAMTSLYSEPRKIVLVFAHAGFLRVGVIGWRFFNSDYRIFEFEHAPDSLDHGLRQDESTFRGGLGLSWTERVELGPELPDEVSN